MAVTLVAATSAWGQGVCRPPDTSNEAKTFGILSVPLAYSGLGGATHDRPWTVWAALEFSTVPTIDSATRVPSTCLPGKEAENTNLLSVMPRPRIGLTLPGHFFIEGSWVPPVNVNGVEANLFGLALGWSHGSTVRITLRGHATIGEIRGPFTCPESALSDSASPCFGGTVSDDRYHPNIFGLDGTVAWAPGAGRWQLYAGGGYNRLEPEFQVHFVNRVGQLDDTQVIVELDRGTVFGGILWLPTSWLEAGGEIYAAPADAATVRLFAKVYLN